LQQSVVVSVGISWGGLERGLVGFLRGAPEAVGGSCSCLSQDFGTGFRSGFAVWPAWLATGQRGLTGLL